MTSSPRAGGGVRRATTAVLLVVSLAGCLLRQVQADSSEEDKAISKGKGRRMWRRMVEETCCALTPPPCNHLAMGWADPLDSFPHHYNQFLSCLCKVQKKNSVCEVERLGAILFPDDTSSQSVLVEWPERVKNFECGRAANSSLRCRFLTSLGNSPQLQARLASIRASRASEPLVPCSLLCTKFQCAIDSGIAADVHAAARYYSTCVADKLPLTGDPQTTSTSIDGSSFPSATAHNQASTTSGVASLAKATRDEDGGTDDSTTPATAGDVERSRDEGQLSTDKVIIAVLGALLAAVIVAVVIFASYWNCRKNKARPRREVRLVCASDSCTALTPPGLAPSLHPDPHLYADISLPTYANDDTMAVGMKPLPGERPPPYSAQPPYDNNRPPCPCPAPKAALDSAYSSPYDVESQMGVGGRGEGEGDDRPAYEIPSAPSTPATPRLTNYSSTPLLRSQGSPSPGSRSHGPRPLTPKPATPKKPAALKALVAGSKMGGARGCTRPYAPPRRRRHSKGMVVTSRRPSFERAASMFENRGNVVLTSPPQVTASGQTGRESPNPEYLEILPDTGALYQVARNIEDQGESSV